MLEVCSYPGEAPVVSFPGVRWLTSWPTISPFWSPVSTGLLLITYHDNRISFESVVGLKLLNKVISLGESFIGLCS